MSWSEYWAHSPNEAGKPQSMEDHLSAVAEMAKAFGEPFCAGELAFYAGWLHDIGKFSDEFQDYMRRCVEDAKADRKTTKKGGDHMSAGACLAARQMQKPRNDANFLILGHHGGMKNRIDSTISPQVSQKFTDVIACALQQIPDLGALKLFSLPLAAGSSKNENVCRRERELFLRMAFSCLVDADSLDTEKHFDLDKALIRDRTASLEEWKKALNTQRENLRKKAAAKTENNAPAVNRVRQEVFDLCLKAGELPQGVFTLAVPTGGGKTLASLAFALAHATHPTHPLRRIIYAIPYTSIIDQIAKVFGDLLGEDAPLLVHHSALPDNQQDTDEQKSWGRLAAQNWDAPLVVTTTVQLFESLFSNSSSRTRKVHNIANSVIILDEAQMLPIALLKPILEVLNLLVKYYGVTVVVCTATQPAFDVNSPHLKGLKNITPIIPLDCQQKHFQVMRRVEYTVEPDPWAWEQAASAMRDAPESQCLAIVNTRRDALALLDALDDPDAFHLSTLLCGAHRNEVLRQVRQLLADKQPCRLVSTQVIECGVDVDFCRVIRAVGPLDRIVQAAGRCNREGLRPSGEVIIFTPSKNNMPRGEYQSSVEQTNLLLKNVTSEKFHDPAFYQQYFETLYGPLGSIETDGKGIQALRSSLDFPQISAKFRMIADDTLPVLVRYAPEIKRYETVRSAIHSQKIGRWVWKYAQPILVSLYKWDIQKQLKGNNLEELIPDALYTWTGQYDDINHRGMVGIFDDPADIVYDPVKLNA